MTFDRRRAAAALAEASVTSSRAAADLFGVSPHTIRAWRKRLESDAELARLYERRVRSPDARWLDELREVTVQAGRGLRDAHERMIRLAIAGLDSPTLFPDAQGNPPTLTDQMDAAVAAVVEMRTTFEKSAELLVQHRALLPPDLAVEEHSREA